MSSWKLEAKSLKTYPHFDPIITIKAAEELATDRQRVAHHTFYPFMRFSQRWTKFTKSGAVGKVKERPIRYASRADAYILARYRHELSLRYEAELANRGLSHSVLAYRRILGPTGRGKCNIDHAHEAVKTIQGFGSCCAITLDISSFFESLDHTVLKSLWCRILDVQKLPDDHFAVFKAVTSYSVVDKLRVYERLQHYGDKRTAKDGSKIKGYLTKHEEVPRHLCTGREFREKIAGGDGRPSLIRKNLKPYGIPQGAPISDLLANLYLLDFDFLVTELVGSVGGRYFRYSDDILIIAPCHKSTAKDIEHEVRNLIRGFGSKLKIKEEKSSIHVFSSKGDHQTCERIHGASGRNGFEYLGFRYDGRCVYLRDSTLSNLRRKMTRSAKQAAISHVKRFPNRGSADLKATFNYNGLWQRFHRVEDFREKSDDPRHWTFWTYAKRASVTFGDLGRPILRQLRGHKRLLAELANDEIDRAVRRRAKAP